MTAAFDTKCGDIPLLNTIMLQAVGRRPKQTDKYNTPTLPLSARLFELHCL